MKSFVDGNKVIIRQFRGEDKTYSFNAPTVNGQVFWSFYTVTVEGRFSPNSNSLTPDFVFPISSAIVDSVSIGTITFPSSLITEQIREDKIFWRVNAKNNDTGAVSVILYGEIWLMAV